MLDGLQPFRLGRPASGFGIGEIGKQGAAGSPV